MKIDDPIKIPVRREHPALGGGNFEPLIAERTVIMRVEFAHV